MFANVKPRNLHRYLSFLFSHRAISKIVLVIFIFSSLAQSLPANAQSPLPSVQAAHWSTASGLIQDSSPTIADLDGDGVNEVVVGTSAASNTSGVPRLQPKLIVWDNGAIYGLALEQQIMSSPAVADIDADGRVEIVVGLNGSVSDSNIDGYMAAFRYSQGQISKVWQYRTQDFMTYPVRDGHSDGVYSSPSLCDLDGDNKREILFGGWDQHIYALNSDGTLRWQLFNYDTVWSSPSCTDLNNDGSKEVIIGADITGGGYIGEPGVTVDGGYVYVFDASGKILVRRFVPESVYSSPAVGDINSDGALEIVVGTSWYWWNEHGRVEPCYVYAFSTANVFRSDMAHNLPDKLPFLSGWPQATDYPGFSSPALADLDGDNDLEVVIGTSHPGDSSRPQGWGSVYAWHHDGHAVSGWPIHPVNALNNNSFVRSSPTVADLNGDGQVEILFAMLWDVQIYSPTGSLLTRLPCYETVVSSPTIGDTDGDGLAEVWIGGGHYQQPDGGHLWRFEFQGGKLGRMDWPMFRHDPSHSGLYPRPGDLVRVPQSMVLMIPNNGGAPGNIPPVTIFNGSETTMQFQVLSVPNPLGITPNTGAVPPSNSTNLLLSANASHLSDGYYELGQLRLSYQLSGQNGELNIPINAYVDGYQVFLPTVTD